MATSTFEIKNRIKTIKVTAKMTKAMKLVASVKFQKWKKFLDDNEDYRLAMHDVMVRTLQSIPSKDYLKQACLKSYSNSKNLYIIVTSSLGLCGAYNYNIFHKIDPLLQNDDELLLIGQKGYLHYKDSNYKLYLDYINLLDDLTYENVKKLRHFVVRLYKKEIYKSVTLVYTVFKNSLTLEPTIKKMLPFELEHYHLDENKPQYKPLFDPDVGSVLTLILPHYLDASFYNKLLISEVSEQSSRRNAMENATQSADKLIDKLQLEYNKLRQEKITSEISEIISGSKNKEDDANE